MKQLVFFLSFFIYIGVTAQDIKVQAISASGTSSAKENISVVYTVGEITIPLSAKEIGSGFVSGAVPVKVVTAIQEPQKELLDIKFFPNPVHDILSVNLTSELKGYLNWKVLDISGRIVNNERYSASVNRIVFNTKKWSPGTYIVSITNDNGSLLGSYQIIKQ